MSDVNSQEHWESVYSTKSESELSWTQSEPSLSLSFIRDLCPAGGRVIDIGGGASRLAERLLESNYAVSVLDISATAISRSRARLGAAAAKINWITADVTSLASVGEFELWHDRAVFHFLTEAAKRQKYIALLERSVVAGGHAIIATFALDGPQRCSGLEVCRYDGSSLAREIGGGFELLGSESEMHFTPWGKPQSFQYSLFRRNHVLLR